MSGQIIAGKTTGERWQSHNIYLSTSAVSRSLMNISKFATVGVVLNTHNSKHYSE